MKKSTFNNLCKALLTRGYQYTSVLELARAANVSKTTAHRFFAICEKSRNIFLEIERGEARRLHAIRNGVGTKWLFSSEWAIHNYTLTENDIVIRNGES